MKIFNFILAGLFLLFAGWQLNDPDSFLWVIWYAFIAGICAFAAFGKYNTWLNRVAIFASIAWMATLIPDFIEWLKMGAPTITGAMKAEAPHIELTREFLGLLISLGILIFQFSSGKKVLSNRK